MAVYCCNSNLFDECKLQTTTESVCDLNVGQSEESKLTEIFQIMNMGENTPLLSFEVAPAVARDIIVDHHNKYPEVTLFGVKHISEIFVHYESLYLRGDCVGADEGEDEQRRERRADHGAEDEPVIFLDSETVKWGTTPLPRDETNSIA